MPLSKKSLVDHHKTSRDRPTRSRRTKLACDRCRMKKSRCDGRQRCGPCTTYDAECVFSSRPKREVRTWFCEMQDIIDEAIQRLYGACIRADVFPGTLPVVREGQVTTESILEGLGLGLAGHTSTTQPPLRTRTAMCQHYQQAMALRIDLQEEMLSRPEATRNIESHTTTAQNAPSQCMPSPTNPSPPSDYTSLKDSDIIHDGSSTFPVGLNSAYPSPTEQETQSNWHNIQAPHMRQWLNELHLYHTMPVNVYDKSYQSRELANHIPTKNSQTNHSLAGQTHYFETPPQYQTNQIYQYENNFVPPSMVQHDCQSSSMLMGPIAYAPSPHTGRYYDTNTSINNRVQQVCIV